MTILSELYEDDYFGLVTFDDTIESWKPFLSKATPENVTAAKEFVQTIEARHCKYEENKWTVNSAQIEILKLAVTRCLYFTVNYCIQLSVICFL